MIITNQQFSKHTTLTNSVLYDYFNSLYDFKLEYNKIYTNSITEQTMVCINYKSDNSDLDRIYFQLTNDLMCHHLYIYTNIFLYIRRKFNNSMKLSNSFDNLYNNEIIPYINSFKAISKDNIFKYIKIDKNYLMNFLQINGLFVYKTSYDISKFINRTFLNNEKRIAVKFTNNQYKKLTDFNFYILSKVLFKLIDEYKNNFTYIKHNINDIYTKFVYEPYKDFNKLKLVILPKNLLLDILEINEGLFK